MFRILVVSVLSLLAVSCGGDPRRAAARDACSHISDASFETIVRAAELDLANGYSYEDEFYAIIDACDIDIVCLNCTRAIVDYVYGL